ncbi:RidA family protein (plasmid) [Diaphorobacter sp. HDW4B]|uniref:RidA family protein n=1 Tax=Diaphorobacter sp. HDW4B TaxID=2714925 RepID=UPI00140A2E27|nr:RidA family protein [Diaphorobacter sp. HDW4B]QIL73844.1 RidA family protein [Diaphorobacter sp. HDW4B]
MSNTSHATSSLPKPLGAYARWRQHGSALYVAGVSARLPDGRIDGVTRDVSGAVTYDVAAQTRRVLCNIEGILLEAGATLADCLDMTVFLVNPDDFAVFNATYAEFFGAQAEPPTRTTVVVRGLPHADMVVEIKAIARAPR